MAILSPNESSEFKSAKIEANQIFDSCFKKRYGNNQNNGLPDREQMRNAFEHAYVSAYFTCKYSPEEARMLGLIKEKITLQDEIYAHSYKGTNYERGREMAFKDGNRDMWNNEMGISYGMKGKKNKKEPYLIGKDIFDEISDGNDFIVDFQNDKRRWLKVTDIYSYNRQLGGEIKASFKNNPENIGLATKVFGDVAFNTVKYFFSKENIENFIRDRKNKIKNELNKRGISTGFASNVDNSVYGVGRDGKNIVNENWSKENHESFLDGFNSDPYSSNSIKEYPYPHTEAEKKW